MHLISFWLLYVFEFAKAFHCLRSHMAHWTVLLCINSGRTFLALFQKCKTESSWGLGKAIFQFRLHMFCFRIKHQSEHICVHAWYVVLRLLHLWVRKHGLLLSEACTEQAWNGNGYFALSISNIREGCSDRNDILNLSVWACSPQWWGVLYLTLRKLLK